MTQGNRQHLLRSIAYRYLPRHGREMRSYDFETLQMHNFLLDNMGTLGLEGIEGAFKEENVYCYCADPRGRPFPIEGEKHEAIPDSN